jgi:excisionase family DNA binding protein
MTVDERQAGTYFSGESGPEVTKLHDFLVEHAPGRAHLIIDGHGSIELPRQVQDALQHVVGAMSQGLAVTILPQSHTLTTQQAADLLGISRPTLIRLLDAGRIPYRPVGTHRRLLLEDVLRYREERREEQYRFLEETAIHPDEEEDLDVVLDRMRLARREVAKRRKP